MSPRRTNRNLGAGGSAGTVTLAGDVDGPSNNNTVNALQGLPLDASGEVVGYSLTWDGSNIVWASGSGSGVSYGNALRVDAEFGDDGTALRGRFDLPFLTIQNAVDAAQPGDCILIGPGTFTEDVTVDGDLVGSLSFLGACQRVAGVGSDTGTLWAAATADCLTVINHCSVNIAGLTMDSSAGNCITAVTGTDGIAELVLRECTLAADVLAMDVDQLALLIVEDSVIESDVSVSQCTASDWTSVSFDDAATLTIADVAVGGSHTLHSGDYGVVVASGVPSLLVEQSVTAEQLNSTIAAAGSIIVRATINGASSISSAPGVIDLRDSTWYGAFAFTTSGAMGTGNASGATFHSTITVGVTTSLNLTRAHYDTASITLGGGAGINKTDHTNDDQHGQRSFEDSNANLLHPIVTLVDPGFMSAAMLADLNNSATLGNTNPVNVANTAAGPGVLTTAARSDHQHDIDFAAPNAWGFATSTGAGSATTVALSDHVHGVGTPSAPVNVTKAAASAGVSATPARDDHKHDVTTAAPAVGITFGASNTDGSASSLSRSDHTHEFAAPAAPGAVSNVVANPGAAAEAARADHVHSVSFTTPNAWSFAVSTSAGSSTSLALADHVHGVGTPAAPANVTRAAAAAGSSSTPARDDHKHDVSVGTPTDISDSTNSAGSASSLVASDHVHSHGNRGGGALHAAVTSSTNGFATPGMLAAAGRYVIRTPGAYPYTIDPTDLVILVDTSVPRTIQLPNPATYLGICYIKAGPGGNVNPITMGRFGSETFEGVIADGTLLGYRGIWGICSNGTDWFIV